MPDFSQYSPSQPFTPTNFTKINLSDVFVSPTVTPNVTPASSGNPWATYLRITGRNPFVGQGVVPVGPAAVAPYSPNEKFGSQAGDGSLFKDIGFLIGRDNEQLYAKAQGVIPYAFNSAIRALDKVGAYTLQGVGYLAGLVGIDNNHAAYDGKSGFANWIAGASDNGLAAWATDAAKDVDNIYRPMYQEAADRDKGFWKRAATDLDFWTSDVADGAAFLASAYATSGLGEGLNLGGKAIRGISKMRGLGFADKAVALSEEGLTGASAATSLNKGIGITAEGAANVAPVLPEGSSSWLGKVYNNVIREAGNFATASNINKGVSTLINTASESLFEANNLKNELADQMIAAKNADGTNKYTPEEVRNATANAGKDSFNMNMAALFLSNLWEVNQFYGKGRLASGRNVGNTRVTTTPGLLGTAEIAKRTFGQRGLDFLKASGKGIGVEGAWEENIQLAIERINKDPDNINTDFYSKIGKVLNQYISQTGEAFTGNDPEAASNIGIGGLLGGAFSIRGRINENKQLKRDVANYNANINAFRTTAADFYKKDDKGDIVIQNGKPVIDQANVLSFVASMDKVLTLSQLSEAYKNKDLKVLQSIAENEMFSRLVKGYADTGFVDNLIKKLDGMAGFKAEDLALMGLDPNTNPTEIKQKTERLKETAKIYKSIFDNIEKNFFVKLKSDKTGEKAREMKGKLYYLSTRAKHLQDLYDQTGAENDLIRTSLGFDDASDSLVDELNDLNGKYRSAKERADYLSNSHDNELMRGMFGIQDRPGSEDLGGGVSLIRPTTFTRDRRVSRRNELAKLQQRRSPYSVTDAEDLEHAVKAQQDAEKALTDFLKDNEDALKKIQKGADGHYRYVSPERNRLKDSTSLGKQEQLRNDLANARTATLNVFNRISDIEHGEEYYDNVYSLRKQAAIENIVNDQGTDPNEPPAPEVPNIPSPNVNTTPDIGIQQTEKEKLEQEKEALTSKEDITLDDEIRITEIDKRLEEIDAEIVVIEKKTVDNVVEGSANIQPVDKEQYKDILNKINENRKRVIKNDDGYTVDGVKFAKVTSVIGDEISDDDRETRQNSIRAGYTVDTIVKTFFNGLITDKFKQDMSTKISEKAYTDMIKQLENIRKKMFEKHIEIVATNAVIFDEKLKIAGEIDVLGVDKWGNFKIYEITNRKSHIYSIYGKVGRGIKIRDLDSKRLSAYRNIFANQYGRVPNELAVKFPFQAGYDTKEDSGFINTIKLRDAVPFFPDPTVKIKRDVFEPIRTGVKFDHFDLTKTFTDTFLTDQLAKDKLAGLFRSVSVKEIVAGTVLTVKKAGQTFLDKFNQQRELLSGIPNGYKISKARPDMDNLFALSGDMEFSLVYEGFTMGYLSPYPALAYKDEGGVYRILDENTDIDTYTKVTGNSKETYPEFKRVTVAYKTAYSKLKDQLADRESLVLTPNQLKEIFDISTSTGSLDYVPVGGQRPDLKDLDISGVKVGKKTVMMVVHVDNENAIKVYPDKAKKGGAVFGKGNQVDQWVNTHNEELNDAITDKNGKRVTDFAAVIELPTGEYKLIALRKKVDATVDLTADDIADIGTKFTASVKPNIFKHGNIRVTPKYNEDDKVDLTIDENKIVAKVYPEEDINIVGKGGVKILTPNQIDAEVRAIVVTDENYNKWSNVRDRSDYQQFLDHVTFALSQFKKVADKKLLTKTNIDESLKTFKAFHSKDIREKVAELLAQKYAGEITVTGTTPVAKSNSNVAREVAVTFLNNLGELELADINKKFAAFTMSRDELIADIMDDFANGQWKSMEDYIENLKCN